MLRKGGKRTLRSFTEDLEEGKKSRGPPQNCYTITLTIGAILLTTIVVSAIFVTVIKGLNKGNPENIFSDESSVLSGLDFGLTERDIETDEEVVTTEKTLDDTSPRTHKCEVEKGFEVIKQCVFQPLLKIGDKYCSPSLKQSVKYIYGYDGLVVYPCGNVSSSSSKIEEIISKGKKQDNSQSNINSPPITYLFNPNSNSLRNNRVALYHFFMDILLARGFTEMLTKHANLKGDVKLLLMGEKADSVKKDPKFKYDILEAFSEFPLIKENELSSETYIENAVIGIPPRTWVWYTLRNNLVKRLRDKTKTIDNGKILIVNYPPEHPEHITNTDEIISELEKVEGVTQVTKVEYSEFTDFSRKVNDVGDGVNIMIAAHSSESLSGMFLAGEDDFEKSPAVIEVFPYKYNQDMIKKVFGNFGWIRYFTYTTNILDEKNFLRSIDWDGENCKITKDECLDLGKITPLLNECCKTYKVNQQITLNVREFVQVVKNALDLKHIPKCSKELEEHEIYNKEWGCK